MLKFIARAAFIILIWELLTGCSPYSWDKYIIEEVKGYRSVSTTPAIEKNSRKARVIEGWAREIISFKDRQFLLFQPHHHALSKLYVSLADKEKKLENIKDRYVIILLRLDSWDEAEDLYSGFDVAYPSKEYIIKRQLLADPLYRLYREFMTQAFEKLEEEAIKKGEDVSRLRMIAPMFTDWWDPLSGVRTEVLEKLTDIPDPEIQEKVLPLLKKEEGK